MFIGHYAAAFAGKKVAPGASLGTLFLAANFLELLWPLFLLLGWEHVRVDPGNTVVTPLDYYDYPMSHSLAAATGWAGLLALVYLFKRRLWSSAIVVFSLVMSNWLLDFITHSPDLPLWPGGTAKVGLGLWNSLPGTIIVELVLFVVGLGLYLQATSPHSGRKTWGPWGLVTVLLLIQLIYYFGPPPISDLAVIQMGFALWILVPWAYWVDRRRTARAFRSDALYRLGTE